MQMAQLSTLLDLTYPKQLRATKGPTVKAKIRQDERERTSSSGFRWEPLSGMRRPENSCRTFFSTARDLWWPKGAGGEEGNARFATSTNRAPRRAEKGEKGQERDLQARTQASCRCGDHWISQCRESRPFSPGFPPPGRRLQTILSRPLFPTWGWLKERGPLLLSLRIFRESSKGLPGERGWD